MTSNIEALRAALAAGPTPGPHHVYTHPRDDNNWRANQYWHQACWPQYVAELLAEVDRLKAEREALRALIADDVWAVTFQSFGQYRTALLAAMKEQA